MGSDQRNQGRSSSDERDRPSAWWNTERKQKKYRISLQVSRTIDCGGGEHLIEYSNLVYKPISEGDKQDVHLKSNSCPWAKPAVGGEHLEDCQPRACLQVAFIHPFLWHVLIFMIETIRSLIEVWSSRHFLRARLFIFSFHICQPTQPHLHQFLSKGHKVKSIFSGEANQLLNTGRARWEKLIPLL